MKGEINARQMCVDKGDDKSITYFSPRVPLQWVMGDGSCNSREGKTLEKADNELLFVTYTHRKT